MLIPPCPPTLGQCAFYRRLLDVSTSADGLAERVEALAAEPLLSLVAAGPFREYTLHDASHARNDAFALLSLLRAEGKVVDPPASADGGDQSSP